MASPAARVDVRVLNGVAAVEHHIVAHIDAHMGRACGVVGLFKENKVSGTGALRGNIGAHAPQPLRAQPAEHRLFLLCEELILADELRQSPLHLRPRKFGGSRDSGTDDKKAFAFIPSILARQPCSGFPLAAMLLISSSDKARSMPYKPPPVFRDFPPVYLLDCGKGGTLQKKCEKEKIFSMTIDLPPVAARTVERIRLPLTTKE
jgi:hypothetical protein